MSEDQQLKAEQDESVEQEDLNDVTLEAIHEEDIEDFPGESMPFDE